MDSLGHDHADGMRPWGSEARGAVAQFAVAVGESNLGQRFALDKRPLTSLYLSVKNEKKKEKKEKEKKEKNKKKGGKKGIESKIR